MFSILLNIVIFNKGGHHEKKYFWPKYMDYLMGSNNAKSDTDLDTYGD